MKQSPPLALRMYLLLMMILQGVVAAPSRLTASTLRRSAIVRAVQSARPSVVNIHGHKIAATPAYTNGGAPRKVNGMGTGVFIDERGYIVTNYHVVEGVREIRVTRHNGNAYIARLVAHDPHTDLAIIKIPIKQRVPVIRIGTSQDLMEGEEVIAVGNAFGYENTVTRGIISALHRSVQVTDSQQYSNLIQTDASINPGNSGGPLLNIDGEMIGINAAVRVGAQGIGFAIPVDHAMTVVARLLSSERLGGVHHGIVPAESSSQSLGVIARSVLSNSPAALAGIQPGDVITRVNSISIVRPLDLERAMLGMRPGQKVEFEISRQGQAQQVPVQLASTISSRGHTKQATVFDTAWTEFGMRLSELTPDQLPASQSQFNGGLRVLSVRVGSPAAREGVTPGDVLVGVHEWVTASGNDLAYVMASSEVREFDAVKFYILRGDDMLFGHLPVSWRR